MGPRDSLEWCDLAWRVERRQVGADGGPTLRIEAPDGATQWLRFDCFSESPHWHLDPAGADEIQPMAAAGDPVSEALGIIAAGLPELLARAGAPDAVQRAWAMQCESESGRIFLRDLERAMRHRPALLEELDPRGLGARQSEKWHTYPRDVLPAWVAEMDFPVAAAIQDEIARFTDRSDFGYPIGLRETGLAEVFAERMNERFTWTIDPARVEILSEVVQGMYLALLAYAAPDEGAIVQTPIYPPFLHSVRETGRRLIENPLVPHAGRFEIDFEGLRANIDPETRVLMLCNPHNPSGRVFDRKELGRLAEIVLEFDLVVVADEIHSDLVYPGRRFVPFATLSREIAERTVTLTSPSKAFNIPGLRCAVAHFGSEALQQRFNTAVPRHVRGGIGLIGLYASMAAWRWGQPWLDEVLPYLEANRAFAEGFLADRIPEIGFYRPEATYLAWLDCAALDLEGSPAAHFMRQGRVALSEGRSFGSAWGHHTRLNFATSRPILGEVLERMAKAVGR